MCTLQDVNLNQELSQSMDGRTDKGNTICHVHIRDGKYKIIYKEPPIFSFFYVDYSYERLNKDFCIEFGISNGLRRNNKTIKGNRTRLERKKEGGEIIIK